MIVDREGFIEVICGPMFAGKTTRLIQRTQSLLAKNVKVLVLKSAIDDRYSKKSELVTHDFATISAKTINKSVEILNLLEKDTSVLVIDEAQFLDSDIETILNDLSYQGLNIIVAGLELDFCGRPFGSMQYLLSISDQVVKLKSKCAVCGKKASRTQRIFADGKTPSWDDPVVLVGSNNFHEPRCRKCHLYEPCCRKCHQFSKK